MFDCPSFKNYFQEQFKKTETKALKATFANGARQLVVQLALETMSMFDLYSLWLTPITNMGALALGAEITTFLAPPCS